MFFLTSYLARSNSSRSTKCSIGIGDAMMLVEALAIQMLAWVALFVLVMYLNRTVVRGGYVLS